MSKAATVISLCVLLAGLAGMLIFVEMPQPTRFWEEFFQSGHVLVFGLIGLTFLGLSGLLFGRRFQWRANHYFLAWTLAVIVGIGTEIVQSFIGRDAEVIDVEHDALGAAAFLILAATVDKSLIWPGSQSRIGKWLLRAVAVVAIVLSFNQAIKWGTAYLYRDTQLPVIGTYDNEIMRRFWKTSHAALVLTPPPARWHVDESRVARLTFYPSIYPGISFHEVSPNWTAYSSLHFGIYSELPKPVSLELRINDRRHNERYSDRYNTSIDINPGPNDITIPLEKIKDAPATRKMDLTDMATLALFAYKPTDSFTVYITDLRLQ